jgi:hypothetical protein
MEGPLPQEILVSDWSIVSVHLAKWFQRRFLKHNPQKIDYGGRVC